MAHGQAFLEDSSKMISTFITQTNIKINADEETKRQIYAAFAFGLINGYTAENQGEQNDLKETETATVYYLMTLFQYGAQQATEFCQFLVNAMMDEDFHPTVNIAIRRGIEAYFMQYNEKNFNGLKNNIDNLVGCILS
ncbi:Imm48 family immunity protein [Neisseria sp. Ec49-e6-T10]|uniref:Imm48 family immunity protein n=1 Tax=Neisseria sp. Ec49-e6-T10 TaxID=3140744 RepID=UPI003EBD19A5